MKRRINFGMLKHFKTIAYEAENKHHFIPLYTQSYKLINSILKDINQPFCNVCIHGRFPELIIPALHQHNKQFEDNTTDVSLTLVDWMPIQSSTAPNTKTISVRNPDDWINAPDSFDLIISCLQLHHSNSEEELFKKYLTTLKPDGALLGSCFTEGTLKELYWAYLMAENQRSGGLSPKIGKIVSHGTLGHSLTVAHFGMCTIVEHQQTIQLESVVDLLTLCQVLGESGHLGGRRKGVYKDLLLAMSALYTSQNSLQNNNVAATVSLSSFIGWKQGPKQPKPLRRGAPLDNSTDFAAELRKYDKDIKHYLLSEEGLEEVPPKDKQ